MDKISLFSSGQDLADLLLTTGLLKHSWDAILATRTEFHRFNSATPVKWKVHNYPPNGIIIAFVSSPEITVHHLETESTDLVSSQELNVFDFIATKVNAEFSIHRAAVTVFYSLLDELTQLKNQFGNFSPLIITGDCLGGSIASLFALWILNTILPMNSKRPRLLCVTFGSPLIGDKSFQQAISERPTWNSSFLHVVSNKDLVPYIFISSPSNFAYMPFGTFLVCSESGCACFEEPESTLEVLVAVKLNFFGNSYQPNSPQIMNYGPVLEQLIRRSIFKGVSVIDNSVTNMEAGVVMQLTAIGVETQENGGDLNLLARNTTKKLTQKRNVFNQNKRLTDRKIDLTYLEWYKKVSREEGGYYDNYKNNPRTREHIKSRDEIVKRHRTLTQYWKRMVSEAEKMPQRESVNFRIRWLYGGTNYRRLVEPLDIADYYKKGEKDYVGKGRSQHYVLLEKWFNDDKLGEGVKERKCACSLTEDSCFWAYLEEAVLSCKVLSGGGRGLREMEISRENLIEFEGYVMDLIRNFAVSSEIFLSKSSFMQWWEEYYGIVGISYESALSDFMMNPYRSYA